MLDTLPDVASNKVWKEMIKIRVISFDWTQFKNECSCQSVKYSTTEFAGHLQRIIRKEKKIKIPEKSTMTVASQNHVMHLKHKLWILIHWTKNILQI